MNEHRPLIRERFRFHSQPVKEMDALRVVRFTGTEGLNMLYSFEIVLATQKNSLPLEEMLIYPAKLVILREDGRHATFSGLPTAIQQTTRYKGWTFYKLTLQPAFWKFSQIVQSRFYVDKNIREIIDGALGSIDYFHLSHEFRLYGNYDKQEFSMQHNESTYNFLAWKMERDGIYYYFDEKDEGEHLVFCDLPAAHEPLDLTPDLYYSPTSGLESTHRDEVISTFSLNVSPLPRHVVLRDYNYNRPNAPVVVGAEVSRLGLGTVYHYGEGFSTEAEGNRLARIRAQALACRGRVFSGEGSVPTLRPGRTFNLKDHYDESFNRDYLLVSVSHEGSQEAWLSQVVGVPIEREDDHHFYRNSFTCIPADVQFRPERKTVRAKVSGMITAFVDAASTSGKPEIDGKGRYKVVFPQDDSGRGKGKASCWLRRMQPHVGKGHGTVFPLGPGVEVMVAFVDGDPDRPFIAGAVPNAETGAIEHSAANEITGMSTAGGNGLLFQNNGGAQSASLSTGNSSGLILENNNGLNYGFLGCDVVTNVAATAQSAFAGLAASSISGFENGIEVDADSFSWQNFLCNAASAAGNAVESIGNSAAANFSGDDGIDPTVSNAVVASGNLVADAGMLIKGVGQIGTLGLELYRKKTKKTKNTKKATYGVDISTSFDDGESGVVVRNYPKKKFLFQYMAMVLASIGSRVAETVADGVTTVVGAVNDVNRDLGPKGNGKDEKAKGPSANDITKVVNKEWGKVNAALSKTGGNLSSIVAEFASMVKLIVKSCGVRENAFGGVHITSEDKNVLLSSATESRIVSDGNIVLRAIKGELKNSLDETHNKLDTQINKLKANKKDETSLLMTAEHTYSGSYSDTKILAGGNVTIGSGRSIHLSTKTDENTLGLLKEDYKIFHPRDEIKDIRKDGDKKYVEFTLDENKINILSAENNDYKKATDEIRPDKVDKKTTAEIRPDKVNITVGVENNEQGIVTIEKSKIELKSQTQTLTLNGDINKFEVMDEDAGLVLDAGIDQSATLTGKKSITLNADGEGGTCEIKSKGKTTISAGGIDLDSDKICIGKTNKLEIDATTWKGEAEKTMTLEGKLIKIGK